MIQIEEILKLSTAEKKELIDKIWESIPEEDGDIPNWQIEEIERRLDMIYSGEETFTN